MRVSVLLFFLLIPVLSINAAEILPEPLTLEFALAQADAPHPDILIAQNTYALAQARKQILQADWNIETSINAQGRWLQPAPGYSAMGNQDHQLSINVRKPVYDFGGYKNRIQAMSSQVSAYEWSLLDVSQQRRLVIMRAYFDVLLADLRYARSNEDMATAFVRFDRASDRQELGQASDIEMLQRESEYFAVRRQRYEDEYKRREARALLALKMNRPGELSSHLSFPENLQRNQKLPNLELLQHQAMAGNAHIQSLAAKVEALSSKVNAARSGRYPDIHVAASAAWYQRDTASHDPLVAELGIRIPLDFVGKTSARITSARAEVRIAQAELEQARREVKQQLLSLWLEYENMRFKQDEADKVEEYRELYLDRARALYEMEVNADLGDAMVSLSEAALIVAETDFRQQIIFETVQALIGKSMERRQ